MSSHNSRRDLHRQKPCVIRQAFTALPQLGTPLVKVLSCQIVPPRDLGHRRPAQTNLAQNRTLLDLRPPTPPFSTCHNLLAHIIPIANDVVNDVNNDSGLKRNPMRQKVVPTGLKLPTS